MEVCQLCHKPGKKGDELNRHHVRGRRKNRDETGFIMLTHSKTCHLFAQWLTNLYLQAGMAEKLTIEHIIYMFNRVATLRDPDQFILPLYRR